MKKRNLLVSSVVIAGVIFTTGCIGKYNHGEIGNKFFAKYDKNEDGYLSKKEHLNVALQRFSRVDNNDDKKITKDELKENRFTRMMPNFVENYFTKNDLNNNGAVTKNEIIEQTKKEFIKSDKNQDKKLSKEEMKDSRMENRFNSVDKNNDGVISKEEYKKQNTPFKR